MTTATVTLKTGEVFTGLALDEAGDLLSCGHAASVDMVEDLAPRVPILDTPVRTVRDVPRAVTAAPKTAKRGGRTR